MPRATPRLAGPLAGVVAGILVAGGCGKRGDPLAPLRPTPQAVTGLKLSQRGDRLEIALVAPRAGSDGSRLGLVDVEILRADGLADWEFKAVAKRRLIKAAPGEAISESEALPSPGTIVRVAARALAKGRGSPETPPVSLTVRTPLAAPSGLVAALEPAGVELRWSGETTQTGGFWAYRRPEKGAYGPPLTPAPVPGPPYLDAGAPVGQSVCYVVRSVASTDPLVDSAPSEDACLDVKDVGAPAAPGGLTVVVEESAAVALSWSPSSDRDLAHYRVYRSLSRGSPPERLAELPPSETSFRDTSPPAGSAPRYTVTAVDAAGNESGPSPPASAQLP